MVGIIIKFEDYNETTTNKIELVPGDSDKYYELRLVSDDDQFFSINVPVENLKELKNELIHLNL